ncbi:hypothetical protein [Selenomonas ruminantium]|uniref:Uncharacterized protein n=1 Tax=Selenomonas ruminantium TaxID=971 RepID=A0A1I0VIC5_SELRU|nr:hypothetical protein [Selenomonas ruminantium]SFA75690.1 hypothetical protein SAMN05216587_101612 [Selenomonas ruminantium]
MALENGGMSPADVAAVMNNNGNGWGFGNDSGAWWIIILFLFAFMGNGWGNGGYGGGGAMPYIGATADMQRGFDQQATTGQISALQAQVGNGFADAAVARCQGNASITQAVTNSQFGVTTAVNNAKDTLALGLNQLAMANQQGFNDNRAGQADLKYTIATENCQDRQAISDGIRDLMAQSTANTNAIVQSQTNGIQSIMDKLCQLELDGVKRENDQLRTQLNMANLAASQTAQTAQILQGQNAQAQYVVGQCCPKPVPAYNVPNPNCGCGGFGGCGA